MQIKNKIGRKGHVGFVVLSPCFVSFIDNYSLFEMPLLAFSELFNPFYYLANGRFRKRFFYFGIFVDGPRLAVLEQVVKPLLGNDAVFGVAMVEGLVQQTEVCLAVDLLVKECPWPLGSARRV